MTCFTNKILGLVSIVYRILSFIACICLLFLPFAVINDFFNDMIISIRNITSMKYVSVKRKPPTGA